MNITAKIVKNIEDVKVMSLSIISFLFAKYPNVIKIGKISREYLIKLL